MKLVRPDVRRGDPETARSKPFVFSLALAFGRGVRAYQWQSILSVARDEAVWTAKGDRYGPASVIPGSDECDRQCS